MKKLFLIFLSMVFISCGNIDAYVNKETKTALIEKGLNELMTEQEKIDFQSGKKNTLFMYKEPFAGIFVQAIKIATESILNEKKINEVVSTIYKFSDKIFVSDNTKIIQDAIEYMGKTKKGRVTLPNCRFIFLNYVDREKIENLSKEFGFKYSYPTIN